MQIILGSGSKRFIIALIRSDIHIKKDFRYKERDEEKRKEFEEKLKKFRSQDIVFIDESGFDHQMIKERCWCPKGQKIIGEKAGGSRGRTSVIAGLCVGKIKAPCYFNGHTDTVVFCAWLEQMLLPELTPGQVVVIDNASFHPKKKTAEILARKGCFALFLPPYSPDLNPIEQYWAWCKNKIKSMWQMDMTFYKKLDVVLTAKYGISI